MARKHTRFIIAAVIGALAAASIGQSLGWRVAPLAGWDGFVVMLTALIWFDLRRKAPHELAVAVRRDDMRGTVLDAVVLVTSVASIIAAIMLISGKGAGVAHMLFGLFSIVASWATVHTLYALRYAELYYREKEGGIDFNDDAKPHFMEFAYFAFTIGMTYQVSDTNITDAKIRRTVLGQALISFVFGVAIIATSINSIASLINS